MSVVWPIGKESEIYIVTQSACKVRKKLLLLVIDHNYNDLIIIMDSDNCCYSTGCATTKWKTRQHYILHNILRFKAKIL